MTMKRIAAPALLTVTLLASHLAFANSQLVDRVAAVVNENVISYRDLTDRMAFTMKNLRAEPNEAQKKDLMESQMDNLVDEELIRAYAEERGYTVDKNQIEAAIATMEQQSKQKPGSFKAFAGKYYNTAEKEIKTTVLKSIISEHELKPRVVVGEDEVNRIVKSIIARQDELDEKELAQIFIPVTEPKQAATARRTVERLYTQLKDGASFVDLARTYSRDRSATEGGKIGWFRSGELIPDIDAAVKPLKKGEITKPVQSSNGWHIFKVVDVREAPKPDMTPALELNVTQLYAPIDSTSGTPAALQNKKHMKEFATYKKGIKTKEDFKDMVQKRIDETPLYFASGDMGWLKVDSLDPTTKAALKDAKKDTIVGPIAGEKGVYLFYIADRRETEPQALLNLRARIQERLQARQVDLAFRSLMRDLRRKAFIDIRL